MACANAINHWRRVKQLKKVNSSTLSLNSQTSINSRHEQHHTTIYSNTHASKHNLSNKKSDRASGTIVSFACEASEVSFSSGRLIDSDGSDSETSGLIPWITAREVGRSSNRGMPDSAEWMTSSVVSLTN